MQISGHTLIRNLPARYYPHAEQPNRLGTLPITTSLSVQLNTFSREDAIYTAARAMRIQASHAHFTTVWPQKVTGICSIQWLLNL